jgi:uncharacterized protein YaiI (UPF0178 family)
MQVLIDADACPVTQAAIRLARARGLAVTLFCDDAHGFARLDVPVVTVLRGSDSADFALLHRCARGDAVITQDYALAALCLSRGARVIHPDGRIYTDENITGLLSLRHAARRARRAGERTRGPHARTREMNAAFEEAFARLLDSACDANRE